MNDAAIIFTRDLRQRSRLFASCIVLAAVPFVTTLLPSARGHRGDIIAVVGGLLAVSLGLGLALALGMTVISRDLSDRRLSYYFAKPIRPAALWIGKAGAALATILCCFAIIAIPARVVAGTAWEQCWGGMQPVLIAVTATAVLFFITHAFATVVRSRSMVLALDFFFALVSIVALLMIFWPLILGQAVAVSRVLMIAIAAAVLIILAIAPVWQLEHGRTDIRRSHAAFSRFFWPATGVVLLVAGGYVWWLVSGGPADLDGTVTVQQPGRGTRAVVSGMSDRRGDYQSTFLVDTASGKYERISATPWWSVEWSRDGRVIAWKQRSGMFSGDFVELFVNGRPTNIQVAPSDRFVLSDDGTRVAVDTGAAITVYEAGSGRMLASATGFDSRSEARFFFVNNDLLRIIDAEPLRIAELDVRARKLTKTGFRDDLPSGLTVSPDGSRMFARGANVIMDARSGATIGTLEGEYGRILSDGGAATLTRSQGQPHLRLYRPDATLVHELTLPATPNLFFAGEVEGGKLLIAGVGGTLYVIDVARGVIEQKLDGVRGSQPRISPDPRFIVYGADHELVVSNGSRLVAWKPNAQPREIWR